MPDHETSDLSSLVTALQGIAEGQHHVVASQEKLNQSTLANTDAIHALTVQVERQRGEMNTRFQSVEDRVHVVETRQDAFEEDQKSLANRVWGFFIAVISGVIAYISAHWPFGHHPSPGR